MTSSRSVGEDTGAGFQAQRNLVRWGAVFSGAVVGLGVFVLLTALWLALAYGSGIRWWQSSLNWSGRGDRDPGDVRRRPALRLPERGARDRCRARELGHRVGAGDAGDRSQWGARWAWPLASSSQGAGCAVEFAVDCFLVPTDRPRRGGDRRRRGRRGWALDGGPCRAAYSPAGMSGAIGKRRWRPDEEAGRAVPEG